MDLLRVEHLTKRYPGFLLHDVSFSVGAGRIMGLIGKNGAGKSTTLKSLLCLVRPDEGSVRMMGRDFFREELACKQELGIVLGGIDFYANKRLCEITAVTRRFYPGWKQDDYQNYLKLFELEERKKVSELSSGMRVKYLIALALSHGARLLLFDEPTSGLDPVSREELLELFQMLVESGKRSVLFSTHITSDLDKCADDITYLHDGKVLASAEKRTFLQSFDQLKAPGETAPLTLEEIMVRTERRNWHEGIAL